MPEAIVIPVFCRYLRIPFRIPCSNLLALLAAALILASPCGVRAQAPSDWSGVVVTDSLGKAAANNPDAAASQSAGQAREERTGAESAYRFSLLAAGTHPVKLTGFATEADAMSATETPSFNQAQGREPAPAATTNPDALTWHGVTLYGAYDVGIGWVSHGLPQNPYNYEGSSLVNRNANHPRFLVEPDNLSQTGLGIRGREEFAPGWSVVFNASTGINPQSGQLSNASATDIENNGFPRSEYSEAIDGARAGQPLNDEYYGGLASANLGTLTFGRQRALGTDTMLQYDPVAGGYAFSYIGYNGTMAGGGDTENTRWDDAVKYRLVYGPVHFAAIYKFVDGTGGCYSAAAANGSNWAAATTTTSSGTIPGCTPEQPHNDAYGYNLGGSYHKLSADIVYQHYNQAISVSNPLLGPQSLSPAGQYQSTTDSIDTTPISGANVISTTNTVYGIVTDNNAVMIAAKYAWDHFRYFAGYEYIWQNNPARPLGVGATDQGGYLMSGVEDNNLDSEKLVQIWWTGLKYAYDSRTDITFSWYGQVQNDFRLPPACSIAAGFRSSCAGTLDEGSLYTDHHFTRRFDGFAGVAYSFVTGGVAIAIPHGPGVPYLHNSNFAPTVGGRFTF
jgi:predicted porin